MYYAIIPTKNGWCENGCEGNEVLRADRLDELKSMIEEYCKDKIVVGKIEIILGNFVTEYKGGDEK